VPDAALLRELSARAGGWAAGATRFSCIRPRHCAAGGGGGPLPPAPPLPPPAAPPPPRDGPRAPRPPAEGGRARVVP